MTTTLPQRILAVVVADENAALDPARQAEHMLDATATLGGAVGGRSEVVAVLVGREHDMTSLARLRQLPFSSVVSVVAHDLRSPTQASDIASVLASVLADGASVPLNTQDLVCVPAGTLGEEVAARLAAVFDGAAFGRVHQIGYDDQGVYADKSTFGGRARIRVRAVTGPWFCALRAEEARAATPARQTRNQPTILHCEARTIGPFDPDEIILEPTDAQRRPVETARLVVSGGRGMQGPEGFALLERLARIFDGAVGGSLPAVDAGWMPVTHQVGQSGKFICPEVYFAVGVSGTPQHLAGIGSATRIVAINNDEHAEIFKVAALGIVADWTEFLPVLLTRLETARIGTPVQA